MDMTAVASYVTCGKCAKGCRVLDFEPACTETFHEWTPLLHTVQERTRIEPENKHWVFRGQLSKYRLETTLERAINVTASVQLVSARNIEWAVEREFQRWYDGENQRDVRNDTLYRYSVMQHYGAPTRLLDWSYSPYVAAYFGAHYSYDSQTRRTKPEPFTLWSLDAKACGDVATQKCRDIPLKKEALFGLAEDAKRRTDAPFCNFFIEDPPVKGILTMNPYYFHRRLYAQNAVFACPGDVRYTFDDNLYETVVSAKALLNLQQPAVMKYCCAFGSRELERAIEHLRDMNIYRTVLFPDLQGFGESLKYRLPFFLGVRRRTSQTQNELKSLDEQQRP